METWATVRRRRLARHSLLERAPAERAVDVVGAVCGIHAQVMSAAELSLAVRADVTRARIRELLWGRRTLVKSYGIRGTIHLFPAREHAFWMAALRAVEDPNETKRLAAFGLDRFKVDALAAAIGDALRGRRLTLRALGEEVGRRVGPWALEHDVAAWGGGWERWRFGLGYAAPAGLVCFGPNEGNQVTFVRPDDWLGPQREVDPQVALAEVFRRYLRAYGPATSRDFAQWFSLHPRSAREVAASLAPELEEVEVEGYRCLRLAADREPMPPARRSSVRLLPHFDAYLRGFHPRSALGEHRDAAAGGTGTVPVLLLDGLVSGVWERKLRGERVEVRVQPFGPLDARQRLGLEREAARIGEIDGLESRLELGPVSLRPHL